MSTLVFIEQDAIGNGGDVPAVVVSAEVTARVVEVPTGVPGAAGLDGVQAVYSHNQASALAIWTVLHNLGRYPAVTVKVGADLVMADVVYISLNEVRITFATPQVGTAYLS